MFGSKVAIFAVLLIGFVLVANVRCAPENVDPENLPIRVRRQLPSIPGIPSIPDPTGAADMFKNAGAGAVKNIPGASSIPGLPRSKRSIPESAVDEMDTLMVRFKREARGTGNLPTKTG